MAYVAILYRTKDKRAYVGYFISGSLLGFVIDAVSVAQGYYAYVPFSIPTIFGVPVLTTLAEGFSVAITIYLFNVARTMYLKSRVSG